MVAVCGVVRAKKNAPPGEGRGVATGVAAGQKQSVRDANRAISVTQVSLVTRALSLPRLSGLGCAAVQRLTNFKTPFNDYYFFA